MTDPNAQVPDSSDPRSSRETLEQAELQDSAMQDVHAQLLREKPEPTEGFSPMPMFLIFLFAGLCFWAGMYLIQYSGGFSRFAYSPDFNPAAAANAEPPAPEPLAVRGEKIFARQCVACHQASGMGVPGAFPPLVGSQWVTGSPERVTKILLSGMSGPIEVKGNTYNGNMPAFGGILRERDIAAVLTYIRQAWGNEAPEITEETVAAVNAEYGGRAMPWTADELLELHPME